MSGKQEWLITVVSQAPIQTLKHAKYKAEILYELVEEIELSLLDNRREADEDSGPPGAE